MLHFETSLCLFVYNNVQELDHMVVLTLRGVNNIFKG